MTRTVLAALALAASTTMTLAATDAELSQQILGKWGQDTTCSTGSLTFTGDGKFAFAQPGGFESSGTWTIADGILSGTREGGGAQPDATVAFADGKMTMVELEGDKREAVFEPCGN